MSDQYPEDRYLKRYRLYPEILLFTDDQLRLTSAPSKDAGRASAVSQRMSSILRRRGGAGMAAPQIAEPVRLFVMDTRSSSGAQQWLTLINPVIEELEGETTSPGEGCMSVPYARIDVPRFNRVVVRFDTVDGEQQVREFTGHEAFVVQHEMDHLDGRLISDVAHGYERMFLDRFRAAPGDARMTEHLRLFAFFDRFQSSKDGILYSQRAGLHHQVIIKSGREIALYFAANAEEGLTLSGVMSRVDTSQPLNLLGFYTQAMMVVLGLISNASRTFILGAGGGRLTTMLRYYYPTSRVIGADIDAKVVSISRKYFAIEDTDTQVTIQAEGRDFLRTTEEEFDFIFVDCYSEGGQYPKTLSTLEFYQEAKLRLAPNGILLNNFVDSDPEWRTRLHTMRSSFENMYVIDVGQQYVALGTDSPDMTIDVIKSAARRFLTENEVYFPLAEHIERLAPVADIGFSPDHPAPPRPMSDADWDSAGLADDIVFKNVGRNDPCPCGSGKKFKKCHGQNL